MTFAPFGLHEVVDLPHDVPEALRLAMRLGGGDLVPGSGETARLWQTLATLAAHDLGVARAIEPHLDAMAILEQAGGADLPEGTVDLSWGVFAAEGGDDPLTLDRDGTLSGTKPWCSLADSLDRALVTARVPGGRRLFAVALSHSGVRVLPNTWHSRGLREIPSGPVRFDRVPAVPVGDTNWYLERPGFHWGSMSVAACWFGGTVGIARTVFEAAVERSNDPYVTMHLGAINEAVTSARRALAEAADLVDAGAATGSAGSVLAKRVRATVARAGETVIERAGHALGPAPLALDEAHAKRVADLTVYLRQHHGEKDTAALGSKLLEIGELPW